MSVIFDVCVRAVQSTLATLQNGGSDVIFVENVAKAHASPLQNWHQLTHQMNAKHFDSAQ